MNKKEIIELQNELVKKYKYKSLSKELSKEVRQIYKDSLPDYIINYTNEKIYSPKDVLLANKLSNRKYVIGDYGAYLEINFDDMIIKNLVIQPGQEYRIFDENFSKRVKYNWVCPYTLEPIKIYHQKRTVLYADYLPNKFYISPYEIIIK